MRRIAFIRASSSWILSFYSKNYAYFTGSSSVFKRLENVQVLRDKWFFDFSLNNVSCRQSCLAEELSPLCSTSSDDYDSSMERLACFFLVLGFHDSNEAVWIEPSNFCCQLCDDFNSWKVYKHPIIVDQIEALAYHVLCSGTMHKWNILGHERKPE